MTERCELCGVVAETPFGMMGENLRVFFCSVDHMVEYARDKKLHPFSGLINVRK